MTMKCSHIAFFFLMNPPPPKSSLFPYTTLFRSKKSAAFWCSSFSLAAAGSVACERIRLPTCCSPRDRKSTRLNSSHGYISYAVFCLKKKKNIYMSHLTDDKPTHRQRTSHRQPPH